MTDGIIFDDYMRTRFPAKSENEGFARTCAAAFMARLNPTMSDLTEVKTAVSEAVTNAIIHGYAGAGNEGAEVELFCGLIGREITVCVTDAGVGIEDIDKAREPLYTTRPELERSGMGFTVMESFMDAVEVRSVKNEGATVIMRKVLQ